jgi:PAS domain S-box-containing protein
MSVHAHPSSTFQQLRALLEVGKLVRDEHDLERLFDRVAETIANALGFATVSINVHRPAWDDFQVITVYGSEAARTTLLGNTTEPSSWAPYLSKRFARRGAFFVPNDEVDWEDPSPTYVPDLAPSDDPDAWHPEDILIVPLQRSDGQVLGFVSVDEPASGRRLDDDEVDLLVALVAHVAAAIESAQAAFLAQRHREALAQLLDISSQLAAAESVDAVLTTVARGISSALGFEKVVLAIPDPSGRFLPRGIAGWQEGDAGLDFHVTAEEIRALMVPEFDYEGCTLMTHLEAEALIGPRSSHRSERNGQGGLAWNRHWLIVPLVERDGSLLGFVWADDPEDHLLPSPERLQALRTFANHATLALRTAMDVETLNRRNSELTALHDTAFGLLEGIEVESVLQAIADSARQLVDTPNAYIYVAERQGGDLRVAVGLGAFESHIGRSLHPGAGASGRAYVSGQTFVVDDYEAWSDKVPVYDSHRFHAIAAVPLRARGEVVGVIGVARQDERAFDAGEIALLERFAQLASLALENARLYASARQSEQLHRSVVDGSTDLIALLDHDHRVVLASKAYEQVLGYLPTELVGTRLAELVHPEDLEVARRQVVDHTVSEPTTARMRHRDGRWVLVEGVTTPIRDASDVVELTLVIARDVTERDRLQEQLRQAQKMESIGRLAGGIAHDFNNLLTAISGYAELTLLEFDSDTPPERDNVEQIARAADRAASLTSQLLAYSRKQVLRPQVIDLNDVVQNMASMVARMLGADVVLSTALDPDVGPTLADPTQLEQVVLNLAINARDAMPEGGTLSLRTGALELAAGDELSHADLDPGSYVTLTVRDTGIGIDPAVAAHVFEPFFTTKDVGEGTGLGLATVHGIVSQSGGAIWVDSVPGEGTTFTVCLPLAA